MKGFKCASCFILLLGLAACSPKYYSPNTLNVPLISQRGEANLLLTGNGNQLEFQGAFGFSDHFAMIANGGLFFQSDTDIDNRGSGRILELGGGYFGSVAEDFIFETYGLLGIGHVENHFTPGEFNPSGPQGDLSANILRIGVQPNFGFKSRYFSAALSSRISNVSYHKIRGDLVFENESQIDYLTDHRSNFMLEPALTLRGGFKKFELQLQYQYSLNLSNQNFRQDHQNFTTALKFNF